MTDWSRQQVLDKTRLTENLYTLRTTTDGRDFIAGQFTKLGFTDSATGEIIARAYSYVNAPSQDFLEFYYVLVPDGVASQFFQSLAVGDSLLVQQQSNGFMTIDELPDDACYTDLWLLATGTGVGPFISLLRDGKAQARFRRIMLVHATRYADEQAYKDELHLLMTHCPQLQYIAVTSRDDETDLRGRIPTLIDSGALEQQAGCEMTPDASQVMICGNPAMIKAASAALQAKGLQKNRRSVPGQITTEQYWVEKRT